MTDRISAYEDSVEDESTTRLQPLNLVQNSILGRLQVKKVSNPAHERNRILGNDISQLWSIPIPRIMQLIKKYSYQTVYETFEQTKKAEKVYNPWGLFLWKLKNAKSN